MYHHGERPSIRGAGVAHDPGIGEQLPSLADLLRRSLDGTGLPTLILGHCGGSTWAKAGLNGRSRKFFPLAALEWQRLWQVRASSDAPLDEPVPSTRRRWPDCTQSPAQPAPTWLGGSVLL